jgi:hypothetical protein
MRHSRRCRLTLFKELLQGLTNRELDNMIALQREQGDRMLESIAKKEQERR